MKRLLIALVVCGFVAVAVNANLISEFEPNPPGTDPANVDFELSGTPLSAFSGWILSVESDSSSSVGLVDRAAQVSGSYDANGLGVVTIPDLENPSFTVLYVNTFTGTAGVTDIDTDNDGIADDLSSIGTVYDALGIPDVVGDEAFLYGAQVGGNDFSYVGSEPELVFRDASVGAWYAVSFVPEVFDIDANLLDPGAFDSDPTAGPTFGAINPMIPEPSTLALLGLGALAMAFRRRR